MKDYTRKTIYRVYKDSFDKTVSVASAEVVPWGQKYKAVANNTGLAFGCRSMFRVGEYAESELEAWERFRQQQCDCVANAHEKIRESLELMKLAEEKIVALRS